MFKIKSILCSSCVTRETHWKCRRELLHTVRLTLLFAPSSLFSEYSVYIPRFQDEDSSGKKPNQTKKKNLLFV